MSFSFSINKKLSKNISKGRGRAGFINTSHGALETPSFIVVGTKATVKSLTPEQISSLGAEAVLANTYHLYFEPGDKIVEKAGGLNKFMNWNGPTFTDSGGFQAFSLGVAYDNKISKIARKVEEDIVPSGTRRRLLTARSLSSAFADSESPSRTISSSTSSNSHNSLVKVDEDGVDFKSIIDGSSHRFTPERSIEIQQNIGADIIFAFDECTSPHASYEYQKQAMDRTHRWAERSLQYHKKYGNDNQALFGIVQGGRYRDLREESARFIGKMDFDGFGIGGSFDKEDIYNAVGWVNDILPENKPRHLLGIGEPIDLIMGIENGIDTFDCVTPTRIARNGSLYTYKGRINILNAKYKQDFQRIDKKCKCYTCENYTRAYLSHLFRAKEMLGATLASIHNLYFIVNLVKHARSAIIEENFEDFKDSFLKTYYK